MLKGIKSANLKNVISRRSNIKILYDKIIAKKAKSEFSFFEALDKIDDLEREVSALKIVDISSRRSQ